MIIICSSLSVISGYLSVIKGLIEDSSSQLPASMVMPEKGNLIFLLDETAGSLLSKTQKEVSNAKS